MLERQPGEGRYARVEREQRWLARRVPEEATAVASIADRYLTGTRLRLRRAEIGGETVLKFGQKVRVAPGDPGVVKLTNVYLSAEEHAVLAALPAAELRKTRWAVTWQGRRVSVDRFHGRLDGLVLAETELAPDEAPLALPGFAVADVSRDDRFSGGGLAYAPDAAIAELLAAVRAMLTS